MERYTFRTSRKRRVCAAQTAIGCKKRIEPGDRYCVAIVSPNHDGLGNIGWWRMHECVTCAARYGHLDPLGEPMAS